eukprot:1656680-Rhodomonas_salina.1
MPVLSSPMAYAHAMQCPLAAYGKRGPGLHAADRVLWEHAQRGTRAYLAAYPLLSSCLGKFSECVMRGGEPDGEAAGTGGGGEEEEEQAEQEPEQEEANT